MKTLRILSLLLIFICFSKHEAIGQMHQVLGKSHSQVITQMRQVKELTDEKEDLSGNGTPTISYIDKSNNFIYIFYFTKDRCFSYRLAGSRERSTELLSILRQDGFYFDDSIGEGTWINAEDKVYAVFRRTSTSCYVEYYSLEEFEE